MHQSALRSGISVWQAQDNESIACPQLDGEIRCDVAVIGSGATGALVSHLLIEEGLDTVLVDQGVVGAGSTASSTGLLLYEIDTLLVDLISKVGEASAVRAYRRGLEAVQSLQAIATDLGSQCEFASRWTLHIASHPEHFLKLAKEHACRQHFGFDVTLLTPDVLMEMCGLTTHGALQSRGDAEVNPYQLARGLVRTAQAGGLRAFGNSRVTAVQPYGSRVSVQTASGRIDARHVVFATGYFAQPSLPQQTSRLQTTYAVASQPLGIIPRWPDNCLMWNTADPYLYLRRTSDGRVIIGGEDTPFADDHQDAQLLQAKALKLKDRFEQMFPETPFEPEFIWAGTFADTEDGLPFIGHLPGQDNLYLALGYGGNGITFSMIAAELIRDLITGRSNEDEGVFRFQRE